MSMCLGSRSTLSLARVEGDYLECKLYDLIRHNPCGEKMQ